MFDQACFGQYGKFQADILGDIETDMLFRENSRNGLKSKFLLFDMLNIVDGNRDIAYIMDCCSIPVVFDTLVRRVETAYDNYSRETVIKQINDMITCGLLIDLSDQSCEPPAKYIPQIQNNDIEYDSIGIHVTDRCNLECQYCYNKSERLKHQRSELTLSQWKQILNDVISYRTPSNIALSGGEPLLYPDLLELVHFLKEKDITVEIISNGIISNEKAIRIFKDIDVVNISLDSHIEKVNDRSRGKGSYRKVIDTLNKINSMGIKFNINSVLTKLNIDNFVETVYYLHEKYNNLVTIQPIIQEAMALAPSLAPTNSQMDAYFDYTNLKGTIQSKSKELEYNLIKAWSNSIGHRQGCTVAAKEFAIATDGNVLPCRAMYFEAMNAGKLNGNNFREIWENSPVLKRVRDANNERAEVCRKINCDFQSICLGGCLAHSFGVTGTLKPYANENDCYRFKQLCMLKMHAKLKFARDAD